MSQINDYTDVSVAEEVATPAMAPVCMNSVIQDALQEVLNSTGGKQVVIKSTAARSTCKAPSTVASELKAIVQEFRADQNTQGAHVAKAKALTALVSNNVAYGRQKVVKPLIERFQSAPSSSAGVAFDRLVEVMGQEYDHAYKSVTESGIVTALAEVGMRLTKTVRERGVVQYIAMDESGRGIRVEMTRTDSGHSRMRTSTSGFEGGSCHVAMDDFLKALQRKGIVLRHEHRIMAGGDCAAPLSTSAKTQRSNSR